MAGNRVYVTFTVLAFALPAAAQRLVSIPDVRAELRPISHQVPVGRSVWVRFAIHNTADEPITLTVPGTEPAIPSPEAGLPLAHVFSGGASSGITVTSPTGRRWEEPLGFRGCGQAPILMIARGVSIANHATERDREEPGAAARDFNPLPRRVRSHRPARGS